MKNNKHAGKVIDITPENVFEIKTYAIAWDKFTTVQELAGIFKRMDVVFTPTNQKEFDEISHLIAGEIIETKPVKTETDGN